MGERTIVIQPKLTNAELRQTQSWRIGPGRSQAAHQVLEILDELVSNRIPWNRVIAEGTPVGSFNPIDKTKTTSVANARIALELASKLGMTVTESGLNLDDPFPVLICGLYGQSQVKDVISNNAGRLAKIESGEIKFSDEASKAKSMRLAREKLLLYDNQDLASGPQGYQQIIDEALETYLGENPLLQEPGAMDFALKFLDVKDFNKTSKRQGYTKNMCQAVGRGDFLKAISYLEQISESLLYPTTIMRIKNPK